MQIYNRFTREYMEAGDIKLEVTGYIKSLECTVIKNMKLVSELTKRLELVPKKAGAREKLTFAQKETIIQLRGKGISLKQLAERYNCSIALISKITKDVDVDLRKKNSPRASIKKDS